jgi:hypothetical protein
MEVTEPDKVFYQTPEVVLEIQPRLSQPIVVSAVGDMVYQGDQVCPVVSQYMCFIRDVTMECTHFIIREVVGWEVSSTGECSRTGQTHCLFRMRDIHTQSRDDSPWLQIPVT